MQISAAGFYTQSKKAKKRKKNVEVCLTSMADVDKTLNVKSKMKPKTIIPEQYWDYLNVFDEDETNQLPPIRGKRINHEIELLEEEEGKNQRSSGGRYTTSQRTNFWY